VPRANVEQSSQAASAPGTIGRVNPGGAFARLIKSRPENQVAYCPSAATDTEIAGYCSQGENQGKNRLRIVVFFGRNPSKQ
jgi:hypothetical protein